MPEKTPAGKALADLKVLDFGWVAAVPIMTLQLAQHGAQVIRVESTARPDASRTSSPYTDETRTISAAFSQINNDKRSLGLNLKAPGAREIALELVKWADVVTENFRPGTLEKLGLGYGELSAVNPQIVMLRSSSAGQTGPWATMGATGDLLQSLCGFTYLTGHADGTPIPPWGAWTDITVPPLGVVSILSAVRQARRTGQGVCIDMSQHEASIGFLADQVLEYEAVGRIPTREGNRDRYAAPQGVYRAAGDDEWVAVSAQDDAQWEALAAAIGRPELAAAHPTLEARLAGHDVLDVAITEWTAARGATEAAALLQAAGVAAGPVFDARSVREDPQLAHRGYFQYAPNEHRHPVFAPAAAYVLSETPARAERAAPPLGADSWDICTELLGLDEQRIAELMIIGALE